jgi:hypothetical protein
MKEETIFKNKAFNWFLLKKPIYITEDINIQMLSRCRKWNKKLAARQTLIYSGNESWMTTEKDYVVIHAFEDFISVFFNGKKGEIVIDGTYKIKTIDGIYPLIIGNGQVSKDIDILKKIANTDEPIQIYCANKNFDKIVPYIKDNVYIDLCSLAEFLPQLHLLPTEFENYIFVLYKNDIDPITMDGYDIIEVSEEEKNENLLNYTVQVLFGIFIKRIQRQILIDLN